MLLGLSLNEGKSCGGYRIYLLSGPHNDGAVQPLSMRGQISAKKIGTHAVSQHDVRKPGILSRGSYAKPVDILQQHQRRLVLVKESIILFTYHGTSVSQMIMSDHDIPLICKKIGKFIITLDMLHHAVDQLNHALRRHIFIGPLDGMDLRPTVRRRKVEMLFHV